MWNDVKDLDAVEQKYELFLNMYEVRVNKYLPMYDIRKERRNDCFNTEFVEAVQKSDNAWTK